MKREINWCPRDSNEYMAFFIGASAIFATFTKGSLWSLLFGAAIAVGMWAADIERQIKS